VRCERDRPGATPFGALDFLAGTSDTVSSSLRSLVSYFRTASPSFRLEIDEGADDARVRLVSGDPRVPVDVVSDLFTLGVLLGRFRELTEGTFRASLDVRGDEPADAEAFRRVPGTGVRFRRKISAMVLTRASYAARLRSADARLHETLRALADTLDLGTTATDFERALRARLRTALPEGRADAVSMARALGMSERTLQRRLEETARTFSGVLEDFRHEEALRLLDDRRQSLGEIAARLGFAEQSSFHRAFKRWTGDSPAALRRRSHRRDGVRG
jgi:AraC-like DNA-binding protein